jgi:type II secretory pathway component PulC
MRTVLLALVVATTTACAPKAPDAPRTLDDDLDRSGAGAPASQSLAEAPVPTEQRPTAPARSGARTGTIDRTHLLAALDKGPAEFLHQFEVTARMDGERFIGWQLVQVLDTTGALGGVDVAPGDVLLAVNGRPLVDPNQLMELWDSLRTANEVVAQMWRGRDKLELRFAIEPRI